MNSKNVMLMLLFLIILTSCSKQSVVLVDNGVGNIIVNVEIADSLEERSSGLMFREFLDENSGMLFVFDDEDYYSFWMKNTLIPLDIIFISENLEIVDIIYAEPCREDSCKSYKPIKPAKYVLEVNGNFTIKNDVKIGNKIVI
ncbi:MAG: DUF192 domain-containing protein [Nanoarchaeota archaeon]|nr:DUF192 domain-containing protein [Nanoarchaeota archaeon]